MGRIADPLVRRFATRNLPQLRRGYRPELVLAFGSRARGEGLEEFAPKRREHGIVSLAMEEGLLL
jgi:hypothetical protein